MSTISEKLRKNRERYLRELEEVRQNPDLSAEGKVRRIAPLYEEAKAEEARLRKQRTDGLREKVLKAEREAFAPPALYGADPALLQMNYRHALDSVEGMKDPEALARKLERAAITGDKTLARAVAWRANEIGADGVVRSYLGSDEEANRRWTAWAEAHAEAENVERVGETLAFGDAPIERPRELNRHVPEASAREARVGGG